MNEYYLMGKEAALEQLADMYDNNGGMEIGEALGHISDALFPDHDKIASIETYDDAMFTSGHESLLLEFAKEASDILADDDYEYDDVFLSALDKVAKRRTGTARMRYGADKRTKDPAGMNTAQIGALKKEVQKREGIANAKRKNNKGG